MLFNWIQSGGESPEVIDLTEDTSPGPLSKLPDEMVRHILSFASIKTVLSSMRVDRKWEQAARYEIKHRDWMLLRPLAQCEECDGNTACVSCQRNRVSEKGIGINGGGDFSVIRIITHWKRKLKHLTYDAPDDKELFEDRIQFLFLHNAASLVSVKGIRKLPVCPTVSYPNLRRLEAQSFDADVEAVCPNLKHLKSMDFPVYYYIHLTGEIVRERKVDLRPYRPKTCPRIVYRELETLLIQSAIREQVVDEKSFPKLKHLVVGWKQTPSSLTQLPVHSMESLNIPVLLTDDQTATDFVTVMSRLSNVKKLYLGAAVMEKDVPNSLLENRLRTMFAAIHGLKVFSFVAYSSILSLDYESLIDLLVQQNPNLHSLSLTGVRITDTIISRISSLTQLQSLVLKKVGDQVQDLMPLITGATRHSLLSLEYCGEKSPAVDYETKLKLMLSERGLVSDPKKWTLSSQAFTFSLVEDFSYVMSHD